MRRTVYKQVGLNHEKEGKLRERQCSAAKAQQLHLTMTHSLRICIIGGSLGGLNTALFLRDLGHAVEVYERSKTPLVGLGAGIVLHPATVRYLLERSQLEINAISLRSMYVRYMDDQGSWAAERADSYRFSSYNALYRGLFDAFGREHYHLDESLVDFEQHEDGATAHFASGRRVACDLLICADGIRSTGRTLLMREAAMNATPEYAGYVAWRGIISQNELSDELYHALRDAIIYHLMPHSHLLTYPIPMVDRPTASDAPFINWLWYRNVNQGDAHEQSELAQLMTDREGIHRDLSIGPGAVRSDKIAEMQKDADQLSPPLRALVHNTTSPFLQAIVDYEPPFMVKGRVCLIGDAAFVVRPHAAAGSAKAAEDGYQLAQALAQHRGDLPTALRQWETKQLKLGRELLDRARAAGRRSQFDNTWRVGDPLPFGLYREGDSLVR